MTYRELTAGEITSEAIQELEIRGYDAWRQNNIAVKGRKFIGREGQSDIIGFNKDTGRFLACESKKNGDVLSDKQHVFLSSVQAAGGNAFVAKDNGAGGVNLIIYNPSL